MLKSLQSGEPAVVTFMNSTTSVIADVVWLDFDGNMVKYGTLQPGTAIRVNTFTQHPWKCFNHSSGRELLINNDKVHYPVSLRELHMRAQNLQVMGALMQAMRCPRRYTVYITSPKACSLYQLSLLYLLDRLKSDEDLHNLSLPEIIKRDLRNLILNRDEYYQNVTDYSAWLDHS